MNFTLKNTELVMQILVTGGLGYIGSHVVVELLQAGHEVVVVDKSTANASKIIESFEEITGKVPDIYHFDIRETNSFVNLFKEHNFDAVIHLAALTDIGESVKDRQRYYDINVVATRSLLHLMNRWGIPRMVFASTAAVYHHAAMMPLTELSLSGSTLSPYASGKGIVELDVLAQPGKGSLVMRVFNPVGAHPSGLIPTKKAGLLNAMVRVAMGEDQRLTVNGEDYSTPDGSAVRDFVHVVDVARAFRKALAYNGASRVFNVGSGEPNSVFNLLNRFERCVGVTIPYRVGEACKVANPMSVADVTLTKRELRWTSRRSVEEAIRSVSSSLEG